MFATAFTYAFITPIQTVDEENRVVAKPRTIHKLAFFLDAFLALAILGVGIASSQLGFLPSPWTTVCISVGTALSAMMLLRGLFNLKLALAPRLYIY